MMQNLLEKAFFVSSIVFLFCILIEFVYKVFKNNWFVV